ncbi:hypothetical protein FJZ36_14710 [Candidatus Poribacteria bacterium]|nr:hypothetical protein [Candidatus Poribacteria bacterium]
MPRGSCPNFVFLIADDQRFDTIRALGNDAVHTPAFDSLAARGTAFTHAHVMGSMVGAVCIPTRAMLLTGRTLFCATDPLPDDVPLLPQLLRESGYMTYGVGKWHNRAPTYARSFTGGAEVFFGGMSDHCRVPVYDFDPTGQYPKSAERIGDKHSVELFTDAAVRFLRSYRDDAPFFLYVANTSRSSPQAKRRYDNPTAPVL